MLAAGEPDHFQNVTAILLPQGAMQILPNDILTAGDCSSAEFMGFLKAALRSGWVLTSYDKNSTAAGDHHSIELHFQYHPKAQQSRFKFREPLLKP